jgi:hypothetical protein
MLTTTLNRIRSYHPCEDGWRSLLNYLGKTQADDEPLPFADIVHSNGLDDALWCTKVEPQYAHVWREFALWCAEQAHHLMTDQRSTDALDTVRRYLDGQATEDDLAAARAAAVWAAWEAAWEAADAWAADAAWACARSDAWTAAWTAAAGSAIARAGDATEEAQRRKFLELVGLDTEQTLV